jgi:hypothetical protein
VTLISTSYSVFKYFLFFLYWRFNKNSSTFSNPSQISLPSKLTKLEIYFNSMKEGSDWITANWINSCQTDKFPSGFSLAFSFSPLQSPMAFLLCFFVEYHWLLCCNINRNFSQSCVCVFCFPPKQKSSTQSIKQCFLVSNLFTSLRKLNLFTKFFITFRGEIESFLMQFDSV